MFFGPLSGSEDHFCKLQSWKLLSVNICSTWWILYSCMFCQDAVTVVTAPLLSPSPIPPSPSSSLPLPLPFLPVAPAFLSWFSHAHIFSNWEGFLKCYSVGLSGLCNFVCEPSPSFNKGAGLLSSLILFPSQLVCNGAILLKLIYPLTGLTIWNFHNFGNYLKGCLDLILEFWETLVKNSLHSTSNSLPPLLYTLICQKIPGPSQIHRLVSQL